MEFQRKAHLLSLIRNASAIITTAPTNFPPSSALPFATFSAELERRQSDSSFIWRNCSPTCGERVPEKASLHTFTLSFAPEGLPVSFERVSGWPLLRYNSGLLSLSVSQCSPQRQPAFCISSSQMALWHFNFKSSRLVSLIWGGIYK